MESKNVMVNSITTSKRKTGNISGKYSKYFNDTIALFSATRKGLKPDAVFDFMSLSNLPAARIEQMLGKTIKTFQSYRHHHTPLDPTISEKLLKLFNLYDKGLSLFGPPEDFNRWMSLPAFGLGHQVPSSMLDSITGMELVMDELVRIEYGDLA
jgi:putative toxin-antitoxin system antitoxin component (TIGR02293 family)